eukprot:COSAG05_NODE_774_length_7437_cov_53.159853_5_plen_38_part_00
MIGGNRASRAVPADCKPLVLLLLLLPVVSFQRRSCAV